MRERLDRGQGEEPRRKPFSLRVFLLIMAALAVAGVVAAMALSRNHLRGDVLAIQTVAGSDGKPRLWIYSDRSFNFRVKNNGGSHSSCWACKAALSVVDPQTQKIEQEFVIPQPGLVRKPELLTLNGKLWVVSQKDDTNLPTIGAYETATPKQVFDTTSFAASNPAFASGFADAHVRKQPDRLELLTRDGQKLNYLLNDGKIVKQVAENKADDEETISILAFSGASDEPRKSLVRVTGPRGRVGDAEHAASHTKDPEDAKFFLHATLEQLAPEQTFLEPVLLYQDSEIALILSQKLVGGDSDRQLLCVDLSCNVRWMVPQEQLFDQLRLSSKNAFSKTFFIKNDLNVQRMGQLLVVTLARQGALGLDVKTGGQLWRYEP